MLIQALAGFMGAIAFAYIYRVPKQQLIYAGAVGALGWTICLATGAVWSEMGAVFLAATSVALCSEILARRRRQPVLVFLIPGVIPLVPGAKAYLTMLSFLRQDYTEAIVLLVSTVLLAGAVAAGIIIASSIFRIYSRAKHVRR
ncbi:MAG TPA: threonine/serine exporter family protein [Limnochordia bacterium]|nr:threonine/serine exporter family protein [Limnochordia bacterium]